MKTEIKTQKNLGIWMDHSAANFIDLNSDEKKLTVSSEFTAYTESEALNKSENLMHNKEQQMHEAYYKEIGDAILNYDHVLLFGPTNAKVELYNFLNKDLHFKDIKITVEAADKMSDNEKDAFVRKHFELL